MKFKKLILGLSILFAIQPAQSGIFSEITNFAKKHDKLTSALAGLTAASATYGLFPQSIIESKVRDKNKIENSAFREWIENRNKIASQIKSEIKNDVNIDFFDIRDIKKLILLGPWYLLSAPRYLLNKQEKVNCLSGDEPSKYLYSENPVLHKSLVGLRLFASLVVGYITYKKTNEYLNKKTEDNK